MADYTDGSVVKESFPLLHKRSVEMVEDSRQEFRILGKTP
jgi:hypothetical protein